MSRLLVASTNPGKLAELAALLSGIDLGGRELVGLSDVPAVPTAVEDGDSFAENARRKAAHYAAATGCDCLADDSGLVVDALDGAPGVRSARFAGEAADDAANVALLCERMAGVADRRARFVCHVCLVDRRGAILLETEGEVRGRLREAPRGTGGFGYDPLFVPDDPAARGRTFAEMRADEKAALSHRGRALAALAGRLSAVLAPPTSRAPEARR